MKEDKLFFCKNCQYCKDYVLVKKGKLYPCQENYGNFDLNRFLQVDECVFQRETLEENSLVVKSITGFNFDSDKCIYFLQNMINQ